MNCDEERNYATDVLSLKDQQINLKNSKKTWDENNKNLVKDFESESESNVYNPLLILDGGR